MEIEDSRYIKHSNTIKKAEQNTKSKLSGWLNAPLDKRAVAIQLNRIVGDDEMRQYSAITFDKPWIGCELWIRRCRATGQLKEDGRGCLIDVLNENGDIIQDYPVTAKGFEYLRRKLKFIRER